MKEDYIWTMTKEEFDWVVKQVDQNLGGLDTSKKHFKESLFARKCVKKGNSNRWLCLQRVDGGFKIVAEVDQCSDCP